MAKIVISRTSQYVNSMREYDVYIDKERIDTINNGEKNIIEVSQGNHEIYIQIDWCKSKKLDVNLTEGQELNLKCGIMRFGIAAAIICSILMPLFNSNINSVRSFIINTAINLLVFPLLGGSLFGFTMWKYLKKKNI